jgi:hypothetical protein
MEIRRVINQGSQTPVEFYLELSDVLAKGSARKHPSKQARCMLDLLRELTADGSDLVLWGMTSHEALHLVADGTKSHTLVSIYPTTAGTWHISCSLPDNLCPWPEAVVTGYTEELAEAVRRVRLGLRWAGLLVNTQDTSE